MKYPKIQTILQCLLGILISNFLYAQSSNINFDSTYNAVLRIANTERKIDSLNYYSKKWVKTNNEESKKMALSALQFAQKIKQKDKVAYSLLNLGNTYHVNSKYDSSLIVYYQAMDIGNEISNKKILEMSYNNIGLVYYRQAIKVRDSTIYFSSLTYLRKSLEIRESLKDTPSIASSLMNISCIFLDLAYFFEKNNYYDSALQCEGRSKYLRGQIGDTLGMGKNLMNIGNVYMSMAEQLHDDGYYKIALSNHLLGLEYKKYVGDIFEIAQSYNNLSMVYFYLQKYDSAIFYADTCSKIAKKISNFRLVLDNYKTLYLSYAQLDKYKEAYWAAMDYFDLNDSLFSQDVSRRITQMQLDYELENAARENKKIVFQKNLYLSITLFLLTYIFIYIIYNIISKRIFKINNRKLAKPRSNTNNILFISIHFLLYILSKILVYIFEIDLQEIYEGVIILLPAISILVYIKRKKQ